MGPRDTPSPGYARYMGTRDLAGLTADQWTDLTSASFFDDQGDAGDGTAPALAADLVFRSLVVEVETADAVPYKLVARTAAGDTTSNRPHFKGASTTTLPLFSMEGADGRGIKTISVYRPTGATGQIRARFDDDPRK